MSALRIMPAASTTEANEAFEFACAIFSQQNAILDYSNFKTILWREDPSYSPENLILARTRSGRLAGVVRLVPRTIYRSNQRFSVAGISSVCVDPRLRGKGFSVPLMEYALNQGRARGFDLALLIARHAADNYYTRFGFWGISSYNKATIALSHSSRKRLSNITLVPAKPKDIGLYSEAYLVCYRNSFGYFERTPQYWQFLLKKADYFSDSRWLTILENGVPIGYVIASPSAVHEIAWIGKTHGQNLFRALAIHQNRISTNNSLVFEMPPEHRLFSALAGTDITMAYRECSYGGHMVKILNIPRISALSAARISDKIVELGMQDYSLSRQRPSNIFARYCNQLKSGVDEFIFPTFSQTCRLLGARAMSLREQDIDQALPFNISLPDQL